MSAPAGYQYRNSSLWVKKRQAPAKKARTCRAAMKSSCRSTRIGGLNTLCSVSRDSTAQDDTGRLRHPCPSHLYSWIGPKVLKTHIAKKKKKSDCCKQKVVAEILPHEFHCIRRLSLLGLFKEPGFRQRIRQTSPQSSLGPKKLFWGVDKSLGQGW